MVHSPATKKFLHIPARIFDDVEWGKHERTAQEIENVEKEWKSFLLTVGAKKENH